MNAAAYQRKLEKKRQRRDQRMARRLGRRGTPQGPSAPLNLAGQQLGTSHGPVGTCTDCNQQKEIVVAGDVTTPDGCIIITQELLCGSCWDRRRGLRHGSVIGSDGRPTGRISTGRSGRVVAVCDLYPIDQYLCRHGGTLSQAS